MIVLDEKSPLPMPTRCGIFAPLWFVVVLAAFGALMPEHSHFTNAVSELGAIGAPHALAWNIFGFGVTGGLVTIAAWGLWRPGLRPTALFIAISGIAFAAAGLLPADLNDKVSGTTRLHILASIVSFVAFAIAVPVAGWNLWHAGRRRWAIAATVIGVAAVLSVALRETNIPPGLAQRMNFIAYLAWVALVAMISSGGRTQSQ